MKSAKFFVLSVCSVISIVASAAEITSKTVRQRWPFSKKIDVDYVVSCDPSKTYDVTPVLYSGDERLDSSLFAFGGDLYSVSDGAYSLCVDLNGFDPESSGKIRSLRVELELAESPLYMVVDVRKNGADENRVTYLTRSDILSGNYGTYETDMSRFGIESCTLDSPVVWTGVTNDEKYVTTHMVLRRIRPGSFAVDDASGGIVHVTRPYWLSVFEWTYGYRGSVKATTPTESERVIPEWNISTATMRGSTNESVGVNWPDTGRAKVGGIVKELRDITGLCFDVPTEAQWELACRAGTTTPYCRGAGETASYSNAVADAVCRYKHNGGWGYNDAGEFKWLANESSYSRCGSYAPNAYGLYDMLGNVAEVCLDWYVPTSSSSHLGRDPVGPSMEQSTSRNRVARGGSAWHTASYTLASSREEVGQDKISSLYGFRLAVILESGR